MILLFIFIQDYLKHLHVNIVIKIVVLLLHYL